MQIKKSQYCTCSCPSLASLPLPVPVDPGSAEPKIIHPLFQQQEWLFLFSCCRLFPISFSWASICFCLIESSCALWVVFIWCEFSSTSVGHWGHCSASSLMKSVMEPVTVLPSVLLLTGLVSLQLIWTADSFNLLRIRKEFPLKSEWPEFNNRTVTNSDGKWFQQDGQFQKKNLLESK